MPREWFGDRCLTKNTDDLGLKSSFPKKLSLEGVSEISNRECVVPSSFAPSSCLLRLVRLAKPLFLARRPWFLWFHAASRLALFCRQWPFRKVVRRDVLCRRGKPELQGKKLMGCWSRIPPLVWGMELSICEDVQISCGQNYLHHGHNSKWGAPYRLCRFCWS